MHEAGDAGHPQRGTRRRPSRREPPRRDPGPLARGVARLLVRTADAVTREVTALLGASPSAGRELISEAELRDLVAVNTRLDPMERSLIDDVLTAGVRLVREVMVPRTEVVFFDAGLPLDRAAALGRLATHSRFPVVDGTHDDVVGFVHLRDLLIRPDGDLVAVVGELTREVKRLPASKRILPALSEMRREGHHLAIVVDEYGGTAGIVTLEDLIEELVGEIHDEYDDVPEVVPAGRGPGDVDGRLNLADFAERTGLVLPAGPYETVGGYLMAALGRLPVIGDEVRVPVSGRDSGGQKSGGRDSGGRDSGGRDSGGRDSGGRDSGGRDSGGRQPPAPRDPAREPGRDPARDAAGEPAAARTAVDGTGRPGGRRPDGWLLRVLAVDGRRVARVAVVPVVIGAPIKASPADQGPISVVL